eukprot:2599670-Alexandrium_andersonii.AAC.1
MRPRARSETNSRAWTSHRARGAPWPDRRWLGWSPPWRSGWPRSTKPRSRRPSPRPLSGATSG